MGANATTRLDFSLPAGRVAVTAVLRRPDGRLGQVRECLRHPDQHRRQARTVTVGEQAGGFVLAAKGGAPLQVIKTSSASRASAAADRRKAGKAAAAGASTSGRKPERGCLATGRRTIRRPSRTTRR